MATVRFSSTGRFVDLIEENANTSSSIQYPAMTINPNGKYIDLSYKQLRNVTSHAANYFYFQLKHLNFDNYRNVGFLSDSDSHFLWNLFGLMSVNVAPILLSPRNSLEATIHLLTESKSQVLIYQDYFQNWAQEIKKQIPDLVLIPKWIANFPECLSPTEYKLLKPLESQENELDNIAYTLHSSGSTSYPKLIPHLNRIVHNFGYRISLQRQPLNRKELHFFPLFHAGGMFLTVVFNMYQCKTFILSPDIKPGSLFSPKLMLDLVKNLSPKGLLILPLMLKELIEYCDNHPRSDGWDILETIEFAKYGGAQLPHHLIQELVDRGITPISLFGSTETCMIMTSCPDKKSKYLVPLTPVKGLQYKLKDWGDNLVELVVLKDDPCLASRQDLDEDGNYPTRDLFKIIDQNPLLLNYETRTEDTIIHISGEKTNPLPMEDKINQSPFVDRCAILGTGQKMNTLVIQLDMDTVHSSPLPLVIKSINAHIKDANGSAPSHSRIYDEMVYYLPMDSEKKLPVTMKGNLMRKKCAIMFDAEVKQTVEKMETGYHSEGSQDFNSNASTSESDSIQTVIQSSLKSSLDKTISNTNSFFNSGMDSLLAMRFRNLIQSSLSDVKLKVTDIYDNDTVEKLAAFIDQIKQGKQPSPKSLQVYQDQVDEYIKNYSDLGLVKSENKQLSKDNFHVAITGANGSLGSFMIKNLVQQSKVSKVYAMIRAKDNNEAKKKLDQSFAQRFISIDSNQSSKIVPLAVKLNEDMLGLTKETYDDFLPNLSHVYHVGWTMNFLKGLDAFDDCIAASKNLMKLSVLSNHKVIYNFVSTVGATFPTTPFDAQSVSETKLSTKILNLASCNGYNLSKLVTETVAQVWSQDYNIPLHIYRVGQVSGDTTNGAWNITEHIPLLIKAIQVMKMCPNILNSTVTWIPVNTSANAIIEIGSVDQTEQNQFSHIVNPLKYSWKIIHDSLKYYGIEFQVVPVEEFINQLKSKPEFQNADHNPIATLTDFFDNIFLSGHGVLLETNTTKLCSPSIASCPPLNGDIMIKYLKFWRSEKFI